MAVETTNAFSGPFLPNGATTVFPFDFTAPSAAEVAVMLRTASGTESFPTDFGVTVNPGSGGTVTFLNPPAAGPELYILLDPDFRQQIGFENGSGWLAEPVNEVADRSASRDQVLKRDIGRSILAPLGEGGMVLPPVDVRAGKFLSFQVDGSPFMSAGNSTDDAGLRADLGSAAGEGIVGADDGAGGARWNSVKGFISYLRSAAGASILGFLPPGLTNSLRTIRDKLREHPTIDDFGAIGDGQLHTVAEWIASGQYASLAAVQADYAHVAATTDDANWAALEKAQAYAKSSGSGRIQLGLGEYAYATTLNLTTRGVTIEGVRGFRQFGASGPSGSMLIWRGGASPMVAVSATGYTLAWFGIVNAGSATDWLEINSGGQTFVMDNVFCQPAPGNEHISFSRSFVRSNGNRIGYSLIWACRIGSVAPIIFDIDGQGTANAITPIEFGGRCIFASTTQAVTVLKVTDESIEHLHMHDNTFIQKGYEMLIVDASSSPAATTINVFNFSNNEVDTDVAAGDNAAWRFFKLTNVESILFNANKINAGGAKTYVGDLVNSHVTECVGNYYNSVGTALFNADATSTVRHGKQGFSARPVFTTVSAGIYRPAFGASISLDGRKMDPSKHEIIEVVATSGIGFTLSLDLSGSEWTGVSQVFTLVLKNTSGGALGAIAGHATFHLASPWTAPATGFSRSKTFYVNGPAAIEIGANSADVAN